MSYPEDPDPRWRAIISDGCGAIVEWLGVRGHVLMGFLTAAVAYRAYVTSETPPPYDGLMAVEVYLFVLGFIVGGLIMKAAHLYGEDGDAS